LRPEPYLNPFTSEIVLEINTKALVLEDSFRIFIVEDDLWYSEVLEYLLKLNPDYEVVKFTSGKECISHLHEKPSLVTLDYSLDDMNGEEVLSKIKSFDPEIPVVVISGQEDVGTAINLLRNGAYDYIVKDEEAKDRIWRVVQNIREKQNLQETIQELRQEVCAKFNFQNLIGNSAPMSRVKALMEKAVSTNINVSITGETGTGKEVVAKCIHYNSLRQEEPFVPINVAAIPSDLIESELFGHEKGAFTGANAMRKGKFEEAHGGTLFLDEIGEMDVNMQSKLLRVLQEKELQRVGGNKTIKVDVRLIVATNRDLAEEVKNGNFRQDLYYRLLGLSVELPALREREDDLGILARNFVDKFCKENSIETPTISKEAVCKLMAYPFPGNVRELKAVVELACVMQSSGTIEADDLSFNSSASMSDLLNQEQSLKDYNKQIIRHFLDKYNNNVLLVASKLDIGKSTIYRMMQNEQL
jgi:two-component system response regulator AtoC